MSGNHDLKAAIREGDISRLGQIIRANPDLDAEDEVGWTPLFYGVATGDLRTVTLLLEAGANPHHVDSAGWSAFMHAAAAGKLRIAQTIRRAEAA